MVPWAELCLEFLQISVFAMSRKFRNIFSSVLRWRFRHSKFRNFRRLSLLFEIFHEFLHVGFVNGWVGGLAAHCRTSTGKDL